MKKILFCIYLLCFVAVKAQDPFFSMGYSASMYMNPALTGQDKGYKVNINYRNQWPLIAGNFVTSMVGVQKKINSIKSGIGVYLVSNAEGHNTINTATAGLLFSKSFNLSEKVSLSIGVNAAYRQKSIDPNSLSFGNSIDPKYGFVSNSSPNMNTSVSNFNLSSGLVVKYPFGNTGIAFSNILQPNESFFDGNAPLPNRITIHNTTDYTLSKTLDWTLSHTIIVNHQADFNSLMSYVTTQHKWFKFCVGYSNANAVLSGAGISFPRFGLNYLYEFTISKLTNATGGAHELAFYFRFGAKKDYDDKGFVAF